MASAALTIKFVLTGPTIKAHMAWSLPASLTSLGPVCPTLLFGSQDDLRVSFHTGQAHCLQALLPTLKKIIIMKYFKHSEITKNNAANNPVPTSQRQQKLLPAVFFLDLSSLLLQETT